MNPPHGPFKISRNGQVTVPKELLRTASLETGDSIYVLMADEPKGCMLLIPMEQMAQWVRRVEMNPRSQ